MQISKRSSCNALLGLVIILISSCVHDAPKKKLKKNSKGSEAASKSELETSPTDTSAAPAAIALEPATPPVDPATIVGRLATDHGTLNSEDHLAADELAKKFEPESMAEAAIALVCIYEAIPEFSGKTQGFTETELYPAAAGGKGPGGVQKSESLESFGEKRKINLPGALDRNPFLQSYRVQSLALKALEHANSSDAFRDAIVLAVRHEAQTWADLGAKIGIDPSNSIKVVETTATKLPDPKAIQPALKFNNGDIGTDDTAMQDAQNLADKGQYKQSVARLSELKEDSPLYAAAQEKIRDSSNRAVQELRRLAAKAFQSAIPVTDLRTKAEYLKEARTHLEAALSTYPQADQLGTVRENLAVINRDLLRISESKGK
jgi:hypothetical protein